MLTEWAALRFVLRFVTPNLKIVDNPLDLDQHLVTLKGYLNGDCQPDPLLQPHST